MAETKGEIRSLPKSSPHDNASISASYFSISISRSAPGCPWENGYQESFYDKFKIDLGDPNRVKTWG
ncbi:MAG: hypothetical protein ACREA4_07930, partial [Nitrososphaera sp.]